MKELGPDEGINRLRHPDCRFCAEHERLTQGEIAKNRALRQKLAKLVRAELRAETPDTLYLDGSLGEAISNETGLSVLEGADVEQVAEGIAQWIEGADL